MTDYANWILVTLNKPWKILSKCVFVQKDLQVEWHLFAIFYRFLHTHGSSLFTDVILLNVLVKI